MHTPSFPVPHPCPLRRSPQGFNSRSPILAKCNLLTQEILLRGLGVMKTTMKLMGRPDLRRDSKEHECPEQAPGSSLHHRPGRGASSAQGIRAGPESLVTQQSLRPLGQRVPPPTMAPEWRSLPKPPGCTPQPRPWHLGLVPSDSRGPSRAPRSASPGPHQTHVHMRLRASAGRNRLPRACSQHLAQGRCSANVCRMDR